MQLCSVLNGLRLPTIQYIMQNLWKMRSPLFFHHSFRNYTLNLRQRSHNHVSHSVHSKLDSSKVVSTFFHEHKFVQHLISGAMMHMLCGRQRQSHADVTNCIIHVSFTPTCVRERKREACENMSVSII